MAENIEILIEETVNNFEIEIKDFSILKLISEDANNAIVLGEDGGLYVSISSSGGAVWGAISGNLSDQTDLQEELDLKANLSDLGKIVINEITKVELDNLIANSELTKGFYKISGVNPTLYGGTTILVEVLEDNKLPIDAYGLFYNPKYDKTIDGYGVAKDYAFWKYPESEQLESGVYAVGQNVIWGGKHWICFAPTNINTKYIVDKFNLSTDYFQEVPFDDIDYNLVLDKIKYDYEHDLIIERNEKNSNVVSFSYDTLTALSSILNGDFALDNPIKNFQWGNVFDFELYKGIVNNKVHDSLNENINFTGRYQLGLFFSGNCVQSRFIFKNNAFQNNLYFSKESLQDSIIFGNNSGQTNLTFGNNSSQNNLTFDNNSSQNGLTFDNGSGQNNLIFGNGSSQYNLTFINQGTQYSLVLNDGVSQNNLVFNNYQRNNITIAESENGLTFDSNKQATKLTGNQFFTGKTTNDFAQIGDIPDTLELGETASTAYRGDRGKIAYDHSQTTGNPHGTTATDVDALKRDGSNANSDVDLGNHNLNAKGLKVNGTAGSGHLGLKHQSTNATAGGQETALFAGSDGELYYKNDSNALAQIASRTWVSANFASKFFSHKLTTPTEYVTGTVSETEVYRLPLPPGSFNPVDVLKIPLMLIKKLGTNGTVQVRGKMSTSPTMPTGTTDLLFQTPVAASGSQTLGIIKTFFIDGGNIKGTPFTNNAYIDNGVQAGVISEKPFDIAVTNYLYLSVLNGSAADKTRLEGFQLTNS